MGAWSVIITGNDTAQDLKSEYQAAFYYYDVETALQKIDAYVREEFCDESDEEEWCNYYYSLADFMWRKGILTDAVRDHAVQMIDGGFGLELWAEDEKTLKKREKALADFRAKLLSPQGERKKIQVKLFLSSVFDVGDVVAFQLKTAEKPYISDIYGREVDFDEAFFKACDGKYMVARKVEDHISYRSHVVPEVADHWIVFQLYGKMFDEFPDLSDLSHVGWANTGEPNGIFICESSLFHLKKRNYQILGQDLKNIEDAIEKRPINSHIFFSFIPDTQLIQAIVSAPPAKRAFFDIFKKKNDHT